MITVNFSAEDKEQLDRERMTHPHPRVQRKLWALSLKAHGLSNKNICDILGICNNTLLSYFKEFNAGGIEALKELKFYQPKSELANHTAQLEAHFKENPPRSINHAIETIEKLTGIRRKRSYVHTFLKSMGLVYRKTGQIPANAVQDDNKKKNSWISSTSS